MPAAVTVIKPYKYHGTWVFDDPAKDLQYEAFVAGADDMIDIATKDIPDAQNGFVLVFSQFEFPGHQIQLDWLREEADGNVYFWPEANQEGWLCPALFKYFDEAPNHIFIQVKPREKI